MNIRPYQPTDYEAAATEALHHAACNILRQRGHTEVLVYTPVDNTPLDQRYLNLGMTKGSPYTCFWQNLEK